MSVLQSNLLRGIALFIVLGYMIIIISLFRAPASPSDTATNTGRGNGEAEMALNAALVSKTQENAALLQVIDKLKSQVASSSNSNEKNVVKESSTSNINGITETPGIIILGMHRSGTSILGGLLNKMGAKTGSPLIEPANDNEKGFFERIDVVLQNDALMKAQRVHYGSRTEAYDALTGTLHALMAIQGSSPGLGANQAKLLTTMPDSMAVGDKVYALYAKSPLFQQPRNNPQLISAHDRRIPPLELKDNFFNEGKRGLSFLNNPGNAPWMLKDPRLCITLRTWLPLLNHIPAVVFTYRHPLDVAMSLHKRQEHYQVGKGLKLWYIYNRRAIQQSNDLCRVVTSHKALIKNGYSELMKIGVQLKESCGYVINDHMHSLSLSSLLSGGNDHNIGVTQQDIDAFIDPHLQHSSSQDDVCITIKKEGEASAMAALLPPKQKWDTSDREHLQLYREVMRVYCNMEDGTAFNAEYNWDESIKDS